MLTVLTSIRSLRGPLIAAIILALLATLAAPSASAQVADDQWSDVVVDSVEFTVEGNDTIATASFRYFGCEAIRVIEDGTGGWLIQAAPLELEDDEVCLDGQIFGEEQINLGQLPPGDHQVTINGNIYAFGLASPWFDVDLGNVQFVTSTGNNVTNAIATFTLNEPCFDTRVIEDGAGGWLIQAQRQDGVCAQVTRTFIEVINLGQLAPGDHQATINGTTYDFTTEAQFEDVEVQAVQFSPSEGGGTGALVSFALAPCYDSRVIEDGAGGWLVQAELENESCQEAPTTSLEFIELGDLEPGDHQATINGTTYDFTVAGPAQWEDADVDSVEFTTDETGTSVAVSFFTSDPCYDTRVVEDGTGGWIVQARDQEVICIQPLGAHTEVIDLGQLEPGDHQVTINGATYDFTVAGEAAAAVLGDIDCDGVMTVIDALLITRFDVGLLADSGPCPRPSIGHVNASAGDINGDGFTDALDALLIVRCTINLEIPFPCS